MAASTVPPTDLGASPSLDGHALAEAMRRHLFFTQAKSPSLATNHDYYCALAMAVRDQLLQNWVDTAEAYTQSGVRTVSYLSAEYLLGPHLENNLVNLGLREAAQAACDELGLDLMHLIAEEPEPGLGNGGLGRLAACFQESMASLELPAIGYGIRYEFGIFRQQIQRGCQVESTDPWLAQGNPWEVIRAEWSYPVRIGGHTVLGVAYDTPILGYGVHTANTLRLWSAQAPESFDFASFNAGDYTRAVLQKINSETLSKVLYPNDETDQGKQLRLSQQIFFVSCSLQDMFRILKGQGLPVTEFHTKFAVQLNDTHPAIAVAELMRLLIDEHGVDWDTAWSITTACISYTNHTLLPEALETWGVDLFEQLLPRQLEIIFEINTRFLRMVRIRNPGQPALLERMSLIQEGPYRKVRMANLAVVGSHRVNGVAELHSKLVRKDLFAHFVELWPEKFTNVTNGVTPRRWIAVANQSLSGLLDDTIGSTWRRDLGELSRLESYADDEGFLERWRDVRELNKQRLANLIHQQVGVLVDPSSLFDVQVKRIHEYKRQHLAALQIVERYLRIRNGEDLPPRTFIFGGKAAPGYAMAKLIIRLIGGIAEIVNMDPAMDGRLRVVFLPNFSVSLGQKVYPAVDLSEQISTAGLEASGTGNMKMALNGAVTIGTLDGANIEIRDLVGHDNFFLFGHTAEQLEAINRGGYHPMPWLENDPIAREAIDLIGSGHFSEGDRDLFHPLLANLCGSDPFRVMADIGDYRQAHNAVDAAWVDAVGWSRMSLLNSARCGFFSSDRSIRDYAERIWNVESMPINACTVLSSAQPGTR
ncbi:glycogen/starch/alpha-glucan phosphorylase [Synechococcus sp. Cruz-9H2]|uniref:glycogen/starch/alpha-glucan phosphorylase n=1 Tax=unclassified Synechococcus TaxID=2626047 RepID=UPI0020CD26D5|nr:MULTISPECIES: glycogen/starch/alpha-glucan phosphorylase [unclassified Synechococcus]MCP9819945.1 glycogen/starch/alpha-glucan phosphorylase [Synechococcus sp. Cruz-9H2]MCP9844251.1 glycogen/starch/alpha-glucan phosphorylase [Synechococcus sp. Edmonson 11F2]MCP9856375.1 glycogen/starch/alpha-glucan phosphorylase [Synechococcus sp. Cruz-9C9]MCP9863660.1 glycogen/starch/alpha-glucan phosphorylase [Synechococcus sp. Cruz-7E5]MCP9870855.1 glycogen/starch/alpha-glucan phosphorylase [Synechococcu